MNPYIIPGIEKILPTDKLKAAKKVCCKICKVSLKDFSTVSGKTRPNKQTNIARKMFSYYIRMIMPDIPINRIGLYMGYEKDSHKIIVKHINDFKGYLETRDTEIVFIWNKFVGEMLTYKED